MKIEKYSITDSKKQSDKPFVLVMPNVGCGLSNCHCSDGWLLSVSDKKIGLLVKFDDEKEFRKVFDNLKEEVRL